METLLKSWKTSLIGVILIAYLAYKLFWLGAEMDFQTIFEMLAGVGFIVTKDSTDSHTKR